MITLQYSKTTSSAWEILLKIDKCKGLDLKYNVNHNLINKIFMKIQRQGLLFCCLPLMMEVKHSTFLGLDNTLMAKYLKSNEQQLPDHITSD